MLYVKETAKNVARAVADLERSVAAHGFGLLHSYDFQQTLTAKGFPMDNECRVLEICNPAQASAILQKDMALNMALPCRVSVYQDAGKTKIGMITPTSILALVSRSEDLRAQAAEVERIVRNIIDDAV
ncbi:MAG: DUF302 domain-containing protein [Chromatiales bacterium]|nr:DUF302 domain-containing protein [Chromatiales bacterium]